MDTVGSWRWPTTFEELIAEQNRLCRASGQQPSWHGTGAPIQLGACAMCFLLSGEPDGKGDISFAAAVVEPLAVVLSREAAAPFRRGLMALREGPPLEAAVRALPPPPDVLLVNATAMDHPRRAGMALHLGAILDLPTIGITQNPLSATGPEPGPDRGATAPLEIGSKLVAFRLRTRPGVLPITVHPGWRMEAHEAVRVVLAATSTARLPDVLREARRLAREARIARAADLRP